MVECLPSMCEAVGPTPNVTKQSKIHRQWLPLEDFGKGLAGRRWKKGTFIGGLFGFWKGDVCTTHRISSFKDTLDNVNAFSACTLESDQA